MEDTICKTGKLSATISKRRAKGYSIVSDILRILRDVPCGKRRIELGVQLRNAWLINSMLLNCEAWHNILKKDLDALIEVDSYLLRKIVGSHSKIPMEFVHLESGTLAVNYICTKRRLIYLHHILSVSENELIFKVYSAQKEQPLKGDWVLKVGEDMAQIELKMEENEIKSKSKAEFKKIVEIKVSQCAFKEYISEQSTKSKTKDIKYEKLEMQPYMKSLTFNNKEVKTLFNLRAKTVWTYKACFKSMFKNSMNCQLGCDSIDSLHHSFQCVKVMCDPRYRPNTEDKSTNITFDDVYAGICEQKDAVVKFIQMHNIRDHILEQQSGNSLPGHGTGQVHAAGGGGVVLGGEGGG